MGSCAVKIYAVQNRGAPAFLISCWAAGRRKQEMRSTFDAARQRAEQLASDLDRGDAGNLSLSAEQRAIHGRAVEALRPTGVPLDVAALEYAECMQRLGGERLSAAVDYYAARHPTGRSDKSVADAVSEFLAARRADGAGPLHLTDLELRLGVFARAFACSLGAITTQALSDWLRAMKGSGRSRNNYRAAVRNLFGFAVAQRWIPADQVEWDVNGVALAKEEQRPIEIYTADEMRRLLTAATDAQGLTPDRRLRSGTAQHSGILPLLVLGAFAGLRTAEVCAQSWADITPERSILRVTRAKGNTPSRRLVPLASNLVQWLALCPRASEVCCDHPRPDKLVERVAKRAGVEWKHNALRHSWISYRLAEVQDVARVAIEAGNSATMIHQHYRELVTSEQALEWFSVYPHF